MKLKEKPKEFFSQIEIPLKWDLKEVDAETTFKTIFIEDKEAYAETVTGHLVAIWGDCGHCTCDKFHYNCRPIHVPCKHLICLREMMKD